MGFFKKLVDAFDDYLNKSVEDSKKEAKSTFDEGVFSAKFEALINSALQDGVLTEQEKAILKKRAEKEGEDWDVVEMIVEARLAEMQAKAKGVPALKVDKPISKEYVKTEEDKYATSIDIPEGVTIIPDYCFFKCRKLKSVALPTTIKKIKGDLGYAFFQCNKLKTISIPNGCERLEELGFCDSKPRIFLPPSLCSINVISNGLLIYCFAPQLEELEIFKKCEKLYVLPQYLDLYKSQAEAEEVEIDIEPMPDEYLYFYDN